MTETDTNLPDALHSGKRHRAILDTGEHPEIEWEDDINTGPYGYTRFSEYEENRPGLYVNDGDRLIGLLDGGRCPVCHEPDALSVERNSRGAFTRGVKYRDWDREPHMNPTTEKVKENGYGIISCTAARGQRDHTGPFYIGLASPKAMEVWEEWDGASKERSRFRSRVSNLVATDYPRDALDGQYDHGDILCAIFELLGAEDYDDREYMGRTHVSKAHLMAILYRLKTVDVRSKGNELPEDVYIGLKNDCIDHSRVQWDVPEWVDFDGLRYSDYYDEEIFGE